MAGNSANVVSYLHIPNIKERVLINVNDPLPEAEDFLAEEGSEIVYVTDTIQLNTSVPGSYELEFLVDERKVSSILEIKDILAPVLVVDHAETWLNKALTPEDFADMEQTTDNSGVVQLAFAVEPDWMAVGEQPVTIIASDLAGNSVSETVRLLIKRNEVPPVLTVTDIDVTVGGTVSYKSAATYYDDTDTKEELKLEVERSDVNLDEVGSYMVTYTVTDTSGNAVSAPARVNVLEEPVVWMDETLVQKEAEEVLESILEETMTDKEKAEKIYRWVKKNIRYISESEKGNYVRAAYEGLVEQEGDCFVFAATARELLTLAEIPNLVIKKSTDNPSHYWNLVYVEDGWYHLDTTPRADNSEFLLLTDAELEKYSSSHKDSHLFDRTLYPEIK
ncbi:MAG: transglutaminase domain-containing protein, partial [Lachnospiraceae bacterium]|nr:transglutaminase domain-containing protein [Lachnospiraceae bacterium]